MFGWFKKILKKLVAEEVDLVKKELKEELAAELRSSITEQLKSEIKDEITKEFKNEMTIKLAELWAEFKKEMAEGVKEEITQVFKKEMAAELKEEFKELQEHVLEVSRNSPAEIVSQPAAPPVLAGLAAAPSGDNDLIINIGPGFKELLNGKNPFVDKNILKKFVSETLAELNPDQSQSLTSFILNSGKTT